MSSVRVTRLPERISLEMLSSRCCEARHGHAVVGVARAWMDSNDVFCMLKVFVAPAWRRQGIARAMYAAIEMASGQLLHPAISLSDDGFEFWKRYRPTAVEQDLRHRRDELQNARVVVRGRWARIESVLAGCVVARFDDAVTRANSVVTIVSSELDVARDVARRPVAAQMKVG